MDDKFKLCGENDPSIKRLGSNFKLTQVHFWVDSFTGLPFDVENSKYVNDEAVCVSKKAHVDTPERVSGDPLVAVNSGYPDLTADSVDRSEERRLSVGISNIEAHVDTPERVSGDPLVAVNSGYPDNCDTVNDELTYWVKNTKNHEYYYQRTEESKWGKDDISSLRQLVGPDLTADSVDRSEERRLSVGISNIELKEDVFNEAFFSDISNYVRQRYIYFSKYDEGIKMDEEGWFSVTPECIAEHHADRCGGGIVIDCFTGVGGNAIRFAPPKSTHVIAIDIDPKKIEYAQNNANIYGVKDHIDFIKGDSFLLAQKLKADTIFLSPPWGGPDYAKAKFFDINAMLMPQSGQSLFNVAKEIAPRVVMYLPRNVHIGQLAELALSASPPWSLEVEKNILNGKLKAITAYFTKEEEFVVCR